MANIQLTYDPACKSEYIKLQQQKQYDFIIFKISDDYKEILVDFVHPLAKGAPFVYSEFVNKMKTYQQPVYAVLDYQYNLEGQTMSKVFMVNWCPETSKARMKMLFASCKLPFKSHLESIQKVLDANGEEDLDEENVKTVLNQI